MNSVCAYNRQRGFAPSLPRGKGRGGGHTQRRTFRHPGAGPLRPGTFYRQSSQGTPKADCASMRTMATQISERVSSSAVGKKSSPLNSIAPKQRPVIPGPRAARNPGSTRLHGFPGEKVDSGSPLCDVRNDGAGDNERTDLCLPKQSRRWLQTMAIKRHGDKRKPP